jgi:beta-lysine 5,6-aminomutase alpha subunit
MPPTKHMTGDVFRGNLLDGFFNLAGVLTGQSILLVGMMTEAVVTPWLSDRDIALQNVRYVMNAAGGLHEDFVPSTGGFIQRRADQVLRESIELLGRIVEHGLLAAIGDGTFGIMRRPADRGKGLEGVAKHEADFYNPTIEILDTPQLPARNGARGGSLVTGTGRRARRASSRGRSRDAT